MERGAALVQLGPEVEAVMLTSLASQWSLFRADADRVTGNLLDGRSEAVQDPHELRIAGKQLRYTVEMMQKSGHRPGTAFVRTVKRMQEELGLWHVFSR